MRTVVAIGALLAAALAGCGRAVQPPAALRAPAADPQLAAAIALFERRTSADSRDHLSATSLAELHLRSADETGDVAAFASAERAARLALARQPAHPAAVVALARAAAGQGRLDEGRSEIDRLLEAQPRHVGALSAAFDLALAAGRTGEAQAFADRLLAINEEPGTLARLGVLAARRGATDEAATLYHRAAADAARLGGLPAEVASYRAAAGDVLLRAGRPQAALEDFEAALALHPHDRVARDGRAAAAKGALR